MRNSGRLAASFGPIDSAFVVIHYEMLSLLRGSKCYVATLFTIWPYGFNLHICLRMVYWVSPRFEVEFADGYSEDTGRPGNVIRLMIGVHYSSMPLTNRMIRWLPGGLKIPIGRISSGLNTCNIAVPFIQPVWSSGVSG